MRPVAVLLVEDNPADADLTRETMESGKLRMNITVVGDGEQALDYLLKRGAYVNAEPPDLILLDLNLPKVDGREVLAEMRKHPDLRAIPVAILTSSDAERDVISSYELGANCFVTKPVGLEAFQDVVRAISTFWFTVVKLP
jgi:CheY-like chemotaxis protein